MSALLEKVESSTRAMCLQALRDPGLQEGSRLLAERGIYGEKAQSLLLQTAVNRKTAPDLLVIRTLSSDCAIERAFLLERALDAISRVPAALKAVPSVQSLWCKEIELVAWPKPALAAEFAMDGHLFVDLCKVIAGKRYPSGQHHWEIGGFPRSWLAKVRPSQLPRALRYLLFSMRGFQPFFETHFRFMLPGTPLPKRAFVASFYRMAASLELQPHIRGLMAASWLYSADTVRVSPMLSFFRELFLEAGGVLIDLGPASERDGFLEGSPQRAELYRNGRYHPTLTVALCSREQAFEWTGLHPEAKALADNIRM